MSILGNSASSYLMTVSVPNWDGSKPCKFRGGRKHDNHPANQLNNILLCSEESNTKILGPSKRRIVKGETIGCDKPAKPHIRVFDTTFMSKV